MQIKLEANWGRFGLQNLHSNNVLSY
jgi:hypothetical protein